MTSNTTEINNKPVIGILTMALSDFVGDNFGLDNKRAKSFLPVAYTQWIENSGARVVPIQYTLNVPILISYLSQVNGVIICGNIIQNNYSNKNDKTKLDQAFLRWLHAGFTIFRWAKKQNNLGVYFPVLGIGKGYKDLIVMNIRHNNYKEDATLKSIMNLEKDDIIKGDDAYFSTPFKLTNTPGIYGDGISKTDKKQFATNNVCYNTPGWLVNVNGSTSNIIKKFIKV